MCGIVGFIDYTKDTKLKSPNEPFIKNCLVADTVRGSHGTGIVMVPKKLSKKDTVTSHRLAVDGACFVQNAKTIGLLNKMHENKFVIGHNRWATMGGREDDTTHPFSKGNIHMVHNGTLDWGWRGTFPKYTGDVDSEAICWSLAENKDPIDTLSSLQGAYALVWYNDATDKLYLARNKERPLFVLKVKDKNYYVYGSEVKMLQWLLYRNGMVAEKIWNIPTESMYTIGNGMGAIEITKYKPKPVPILPYLPYANEGWHNKATDYYNKYRSGRNNARVYKEETIDLNKNCYYSSGDKIEFYFTKMEYKTENSRHGKLIGIAKEAPYYKVEALGIGLGEFNGRKVLSGKVSSMIRYPDGGYPVLRVIAVVATNKRDVMDRIVNGNDPKEEVPAIEKSNLPQVKVSVDDDYSCSSCGEAIPTKDIADTEFTQMGFPICLSCQLELSMPDKTH